MKSSSACATPSRNGVNAFAVAAANPAAAAAFDALAALPTEDVFLDFVLGGTLTSATVGAAFGEACIELELAATVEDDEAAGFPPVAGANAVVAAAEAFVA